MTQVFDSRHLLSRILEVECSLQTSQLGLCSISDTVGILTVGHCGLRLFAVMLRLLSGLSSESIASASRIIAQIRGLTAMSTPSCILLYLIPDWCAPSVACSRLSSVNPGKMSLSRDLCPTLSKVSAARLSF